MEADGKFWRVFFFQGTFGFVCCRELSELISEDLFSYGVYGGRDQQLRGFYSTEFYFHELKRTGAKILPPCVNEGEHLTSIHGEVVYIGFIHVQNLEKKTTERILVERSTKGQFVGLEDFIERTRVNAEQLNILIRAGAFHFTGKNKKELLWLANFQRKRIDRQPLTAALFGSIQ